MDIFHLRHWNQAVGYDEWHHPFKQITELLINNDLILAPVAKTYSLFDVKEAVKVANKLQGKVFLVDDNSVE